MATVLIGFMGAGKSSAAQELSTDPIDTDALLVQRLGRSIAEVFASDGEGAFRSAEEQLVVEVLDRAGKDDVISLGGGAVTSQRVRDALASHLVVWLDVTLATAWARVSRSGRRDPAAARPLAASRDEFDRLYADRATLYESLADVFLPEGGRAAPAREHWQRLANAPAGTRMAWAIAGQYPVYVGRSVLGLDAGPAGARRFVITDEHVGDLYLDRLGEIAGVIEIPAGESHKTLATAGRAWRALAAQGATRADAVIALGGGVVGDLAGFVAHGYQRGVPVVQLPTTLVSMVDSALGGKTGVDLPEGKNYVGAYHQPAAVVIDATALATLPPEEHAAGYAEIVKTALIAGGSLWDRVSRGEPVDDEVILACARTKLAIVAADERDSGLRQLLNLGHTVGHALETATSYERLRHGEAVALGLLAALRLSGQDELRAQVAGLLETAMLPTTIGGIDPGAVVDATRADKKRLGDDVPFVLVRSPGDVVHGQFVEQDELRAAVEEIIER